MGLQNGFNIFFIKELRNVVYIAINVRKINKGSRGGGRGLG